MPTGSQVTDKATPSKEIAQALKADLCAWKAAINNEPKLWQEAINAANFVIDSCHYTLATDPEEVCTKVLPGGSDEGIFEIKFNYVEATRNPWTPMEESSRSRFAQKTDGETSNTATPACSKQPWIKCTRVILKGRSPRVCTKETNADWPISMTSTQSVKTPNGTLWQRDMPTRTNSGKYNWEQLHGAKVNSNVSPVTTSFIAWRPHSPPGRVLRSHQQE